MNNEMRVVPVFAALILAACGGGGGGDGPPPNPPPSMSPQSFSGNENATVSGQIVATDAGDTLTFTLISDPSNGAVTAFSNAGAFTYTPRRFFFGSVSCSVSVRDSGGNNVVATMTIVLAAVNDPPVANDDVLSVASAANIDVL